jgi:hypothetical protein
VRKPHLFSRLFQARASAAVLLLACSSAASGYYHFVHYRPDVSGYRQIPEKFDLTALVNNTVTYVVSDTGPDKLADGDSMASLMSQIHLAARTWSSVTGSEIRLAFGGLVKAGTPAVAPEIEIVFDEVPPGLVALGGPTIRGEVAGGDAAPFVPILKSTIILRKDLSTRPSWGEAFFLTLMHEMGHTLGLQHSQSASVMSTEITRAVTKAAPLGDDDRAGLMALYAVPGAAAGFGSISGRVSAGPDGMNLASVVALTSDGTAVNALTNPDGTYRLTGLPEGNYFVHVHPLPPALSGEAYPDNVVPPSILGGSLLPGSGLFQSQFFPGVQQTDDASVVVVKAGEPVENVNFAVARRTSLPVYAVQTYSFPGSVAVKPGHLSQAYADKRVVAAGAGLVAGGAPAAGLGVSVIGTSAAIAAVRPYASSPSYLQLDTQLHPIPGQGARHLMFRQGGVIHVVPAGFRVVGARAPQLDEMAVVKDDTGLEWLELRGTGFTAASRVLFDGVPVPVAAAADKALRLTPPAGAKGQAAAVVVLNSDGQSSLFWNGKAQVYTYADAAEQGISVEPSKLISGVETLVEIRSSGPAFQTASQVSFGTADVAVRRMWVVAPDRILANVIALPGAAAARNTLAVTTGLRTLTLTGGLEMAEMPQRVVSVAGAIIDEATGRPAISPAFNARVQLKGVAANLTRASFDVRVAGLAAPVAAYAGSVLVFRMPAGLPPGPAVVNITAAGEALPPVLVAVDLPPPVITAIKIGTVARAAQPGEIVTLQVTGLTEGIKPVDAVNLRLTVEGVPAKIVRAVVTERGHDVDFELDAHQPHGAARLVISIDGRSSDPFTLAVQ